VNGAAAGAGFGLALAADIRIVAASARLTAGYVRRGLSPDAGVSYLLPRLVGQSVASDILLTGRDVDASEAQRIGLAALVVPDGEFSTAVVAFAERMAAGPPIAYALTKRLIIGDMGALESHLARELAYIKTCFSSRDVAEAMAAFAAKRAPAFRGE
jgi:2-(1,2-epoxy-1,2-dihydrophenyl)acetyl-CoA isomerase